MARIPRRKALISYKNQKVCLNFGTYHIELTEQWNMVLLSDWFKLNLFVSDVMWFIRGKTGECLSFQCFKKTRNLEAKRHRIGMISSSGVGPIFRFHGNINASVYKERTSSFTQRDCWNSYIYMQDNTPCHKAKTVLNFLEEEGIAVMKRLPQGPDMNPQANASKIIGERELRTEILKILMIYGFFWKNGKVSLPHFVRSLLAQVVEDAMR